MSEAELLVHRADAPRRGFWSKRTLLIGGVLAVVAVVATVSCIVWISTKSLRDAVAEADRLDPGWRITEVEAHREMIPNEKNSALALMAAGQNLPAQWPMWEYQLAALSRAPLQNPAAPNPEEEDLTTFQEKLHNNSDPPVLLSEHHLKILRDELARAAPAMTPAHQILDMPRGRYPIAYSSDYISTPLPYIQGTRGWANKFAYEATLRANENDMEGALLACRGIFRTGGSIGDEPTLISTLVRIATRHLALRKVEQTLALGQPSEASLAALQHFLEEEAKEPLFLIGMRGERGMMDGTMQAIQSGEISLKQISQILQDGHSQFGGQQQFEAVYIVASIRAQRAALLHWMNEAVEIAKLPAEQQKATLKELDEKAKNLPVLARMLAPACAKVGEAWARDQVCLRCVIVLVAIERYRKAHGHWPESLKELVPQYLASVPVDVHDGQPLHFRRFAEGVMVYSVGPDGVDNGGNLDKNAYKPGTDFGFQLWDVARRRQPPNDKKQTPVSP